jgi:peptide/nickel transport system permease protein/oligopeptide transport system permease protein
MLILVFSLHLGWFPVFGTGSWRHMVLPAIALATGTMGIIARLTRSSMLEVLNEDHIRTAWAKGASEGRVMVKHALRVALIPVVTVVGLQFGILLGGSVLTETIFSWPGIGKFMYDAILSRDYAALQATALTFALLVALLNLAVDLSYGLIDPRVRYD